MPACPSASFIGLSLAAILDEADAFFMGKGKLHEAAGRISRNFDEMGIPYAIAGAVALAAHGRRRLSPRRGLPG